MAARSPGGDIPLSSFWATVAISADSAFCEARTSPATFAVSAARAATLAPAGRGLPSATWVEPEAFLAPRGG
eukprot:3938282-Pyramimonas_sp.AAC.1